MQKHSAARVLFSEVMSVVRVTRQPTVGCNRFSRMMKLAASAATPLLQPIR
jgi:hypothetical protein